MAGFVLTALSAIIAAGLAGYFGLLKPRRPATAALTLLSLSLFVDACLKLAHDFLGRQLDPALLAADCLRLLALATMLAIILRHEIEIPAEGPRGR